MIGAGLGIVPGIGGSVVNWLTYGVASSTARKNNRFGRGDVRGVIAPEAGNNATEGGQLVPTMLFESRVAARRRSCWAASSFSASVRAAHGQ